MRCHLLRVGPPAPAGPLHDLVGDVARHALPLPVEDTESASWASADGTVRAWSWSNEASTTPGHPDPLHTAEQDTLLLGTGYALEPGPRLARRLERIDGPGDPFAGAGGIWSVALAWAGEALAASCLAGVEPWFVAENGTEVWLGSRARMVHLAARGDAAAPPEADLLGLAALVNVGHPLVGRTSYAGVRYAGAGALVRARLDGGRARVTVTARPRPSGEVTDPVEGGRLVAEALVRAVAPLRDWDEPVRLGLTGGRDSRMVAAALRAAGVPTRTFTKALASGSADLDAARRVAAVLGMEHERLDPELPGAAGVLVDVEGRLRNAAVRCDGQLSAFDATGELGTTYSASATVLSGASGEVVRGGYAATAVYPRRGRNGPWWIRNGPLFGRVHLLEPALQEAYREELRPWVERVDEDAARALDEYYLLERTARWGGAARQGNALAATPRTPLLDDLVLHAVYSVNPAVRAGEEVLREVLRALTPELLDVPYAGRRLRCDAVLPADADAQVLRRWQATEPVTVGGGAPAFSWRLHYGEEVAGRLRRRLDVPAASRLLDRDAARAAVPVAGSADPVVAEGAWNLVTAVDVLTGRYHDPAARHLPTRADVLVPVPVGSGAAGVQAGVQAGGRTRTPPPARLRGWVARLPRPVRTRAARLYRSVRG